MIIISLSLTIEKSRIYVFAINTIRIVMAGRTIANIKYVITTAIIII
jgi:hypothetical protein